MSEYVTGLLLYKIAGTVTDHRENIPNLIVECFNKDSETDIYLGYTATDKKGQFELLSNMNQSKELLR